ncbi:MAG: TRAM domain-containing protein [Alphaproteobacteria bacterium]|nr:TRAM domain-containing protein [Alphaproteobacteria bacterium]
MGCFRYENVAEADSGALDGHVSEEVKEDRWNRFMAVQQEISAARLQLKIGKTLPVLIDSVTPEGIIGRTAADAPEIDGVVHIQSKGRVLPGTIVQVKIDDADEYDLYGSVVSSL